MVVTVPAYFTEKEVQFVRRKSSEPSLEVSMGYDASGMVAVVVRDLISGRTEDITVNFCRKNRARKRREAVIRNATKRTCGQPRKP